MNEIFQEVITAISLLMIIPAGAFLVLLWRGTKAEIKERKERRQNGPDYI